MWQEEYHYSTIISSNMCLLYDLLDIHYILSNIFSIFFENSIIFEDFADSSMDSYL